MSLTVDIRKKLGTFDLDVAFDIGNETLGFLGASGCGKSLTLRCIAGVDTPDEGRIVVNDTVFFDSEKNIDLSPQQRKTALLFQNFQLFPNFCVEDNIAAGIDRDIPKQERQRIIDETIEMFGLGDYRKRYPTKLSGGQQQRVALARMLAAKPKILMLDEPFSALDSHLKSALEQDLLDLFDHFEGSVLYVSHDIDEAFRFCDSIAVVDKGAICEIGPTKRIVSNPSTLATIKLSGCKNTSAARKIDDHTLEALDWNLVLESHAIVPDDIKYVGVRAFYLSRAKGETCNVVPMIVDRVSDSRFERTVMVKPQGHENIATRIQWKVDKLITPEEELPQRGDLIDVYIQPNKLYLVSR